MIREHVQNLINELYISKTPKCTGDLHGMDGSVCATQLAWELIPDAERSALIEKLTYLHPTDIIYEAVTRYYGFPTASFLYRINDQAPVGWEGFEFAPVASRLQEVLDGGF